MKNWPASDHSSDTSGRNPTVCPCAFLDESHPVFGATPSSSGHPAMYTWPEPSMPGQARSPSRTGLNRPSTALLQEVTGPCSLGLSIPAGRIAKRPQTHLKGGEVAQAHGLPVCAADGLAHQAGHPKSPWGAGQRWVSLQRYDAVVLLHDARHGRVRCGQRLQAAVAERGLNKLDLFGAKNGDRSPHGEPKQAYHSLWRRCRAWGNSEPSASSWSQGICMLAGRG